MYQNKFRGLVLSLLLISVLTVLSGLKKEPDRPELVHILAYFKENALAFSGSAQRLDVAVRLLDGSVAADERAKQALKDCRLHYKRISFFLDYFFESSSWVYNNPPKVEVEEPYMEYQEPSGLQVIEALLYEGQSLHNKERLLEQTALISSSADDLGALGYRFDAGNAEILESLKLELVRIMALSISGYDAPELKSGIDEAHESLSAMKEVLRPFLKRDKPSQVLSDRLDRALAFTSGRPDFNAFDRMAFLRGCAMPLQEALRDLARTYAPVAGGRTALNPLARNLFAKDAFDPAAFPAGQVVVTAEMVRLGKALFFDKALSGNLKRSCASCHQPEKSFSDGLKANLTFDGKAHLERNTPGLTYAGYQHAQFWDGRAASLKDQVLQVIRNPLEMNADPQKVLVKLQQDPHYIKAFSEAFGAGKTIGAEELALALAAYVQSLTPFNSAFDRYINGSPGAMTKAQVRGFNLFMGKAQCGTCHFIPLFNGLIPPFYKRTEFEVLGTPANEDPDHPEKDRDKGRSGFFSIEYYQGAFKTPGLRNAALTAPYMHNGVFKTMEQLMDFYNKGGGAGIGLEIPNQTLPAKALQLSPKEIRDIIVFVESLTDKK